MKWKIINILVCNRHEAAVNCPAFWNKCYRRWLTSPVSVFKSWLRLNELVDRQKLMGKGHVKMKKKKNAKQTLKGFKWDLPVTRPQESLRSKLKRSGHCAAETITALFNLIHKPTSKGNTNKIQTVGWLSLINSLDNKPGGKLASYCITKVGSRIISLDTQSYLLVKPQSQGPVKDKGNLLSDQSPLIPVLPKAPPGRVPQPGLFMITSLNTV